MLSCIFSNHSVVNFLYFFTYFYAFIISFISTEPGAVDDLIVDVLDLYAVNITWLPPEALNGILLAYYLNITRELSSGLEVFYSIELEPQEEFYVTLHNLGLYINQNT